MLTQTQSISSPAPNPSPSSEERWNFYAKKMAKVDECFSASGSIRSNWEPIMSTFASASEQELNQFLEHVSRDLRQNGVTYNIGTGNEPERRIWPLDPIPLLYDQQQWAGIEQGLLQRANLMNLLLKDLYGAQRLIKDGTIPQELIFRHSKFLRACSGITPPHEEMLNTYSANLARDASGRMWVVNDYGEAPHGAGYALENRLVAVSALPKAFSECKIRRLASFFREFKRMLISRARNTNGEDPRIILLTAGPSAPAYFEHAYLAAYLGVTLVQLGDLTVRRSHVYLKSLGGLEQVDVIFRMVSGNHCDPLAIPGAGGGIPGLVEVARQGNVAIVNPLGSGVLENPGLYAFLPQIAKKLLGEDLLLPNAATWWCGEEKELNYVLSNLKTLVIKSIRGVGHFDTTFGSTLTEGEILNLRNLILKDPALFVAQQQVHYSSAPSIEDGVIEPRRQLTRGFVTAKASGGYAVMPGGLVKTAGSTETRIVSSRLGAESKDAWVMGGTDDEFVSLWTDRTELKTISTRRSNLPSRAGENLFWTGRYTSRIECLARMLRYALKCYFFDAIPGDTVRAEHISFVISLVERVCEIPPLDVANHQKSSALLELDSMLSDSSRGGSIPSSLSFLRSSSTSVKDLWSEDSQRILTGVLKYEYRNEVASNAFYQEASDRMSGLITNINAFVGLSLESMTRDGGWLLLDAGRRVEQGQFILSVFIQSLSAEHPAQQEALIHEAVLASLDSLVTYRRTFATQLNLELILQLMLVDPNNPRSFLYQVNQLEKHIAKLPASLDFDEGEHPVRLVIDSLLKKIGSLKIEDLVAISGATSRREGLVSHLEDMSASLSDLARELDALYFRHADAFTSLD